MLETGKLYLVPFVARYGNANVEDWERCKELCVPVITQADANEYDRFRSILFSASDIVMILEVDPARCRHAGDPTGGRKNYIYLKLLTGEKVVEIYASKLWVNAFKLASATI